VADYRQAAYPHFSWLMLAGGPRERPQSFSGFWRGGTKMRETISCGGWATGGEAAHPRL